VIIYHQKNVAAVVHGHTYWFLPNQILTSQITITSTTPFGVVPLFPVRVHLGSAPNNKVPLSLNMADADVTVRVHMTDIIIEVF